MKKIIILIFGLLLIAGCKENESVNVPKEFEKKIDKAKSYKLSGTMEIQNDEEIFKYNIDVSYLKDDYYKVEMLNTSNEHKQIILKNKEGLYVVTPSLNKSFKFESSWPDNSSQGYILSSIVKDIKNDDSKEISNENEQYIIKSKVSYPNNDELSYQKVYLDKQYTIKKVEVYNNSDLVKIKVEFKDVDLKAGLKESEFDLKKYVDTSICENDNCDKKTMGDLDKAIYPLYMPSNTYLSESEVINNEDNARVILTYAGDKNFVLIEEVANINNEHEIIPVYGEPLMLNDTIAALSTNSMYWTSNSIDYYLVSEDLSINEMVYIATSLSNASATIASK